MSAARLSSDLPPLMTSHDAEQVSRLAKELQLSTNSAFQKYLAVLKTVIGPLTASGTAVEQALVDAKLELTEAQQKTYKVMAAAIRDLVNTMVDDAFGFARLVERFGLGTQVKGMEHTAQDGHKHEPVHCTSSGQKSRKSNPRSKLGLASVAPTSFHGAAGLSELKHEPAPEKSSCCYLDSLSTTATALETKGATKIPPSVSSSKDHACLAPTLTTPARVGRVKTPASGQGGSSREATGAISNLQTAKTTARLSADTLKKDHAPSLLSGAKGSIVKAHVKGASTAPRRYRGSDFGNWRVTKAVPLTKDRDKNGSHLHRGVELYTIDEQGRLKRACELREVCEKYCGIPYAKDFNRIKEAHSEIYRKVSIVEECLNCVQVTPAWREEVKESLGFTISDDVTFVVANTSSPLPPPYIFQIQDVSEIVIDDCPYWRARPQSSPSYELSFIGHTTKKVVPLELSYMEGAGRYRSEDFEAREKRETTYSVSCRTSQNRHSFFDGIGQLNWKVLSREFRGRLMPKIKFSGSPQSMLVSLQALDFEGRRAIKKLQLRFTVKEEVSKPSRGEPSRYIVASSRNAWAQLFKFIRNTLNLSELCLVISEPMWPAEEKIENYGSIFTANPWLQNVTSVKGLQTFRLRINRCWTHGKEGGLIAVTLERYLQAQMTTKLRKPVGEFVTLIRQRQEMREDLTKLFNRVAVSQDFLVAGEAGGMEAWTERTPKELSEHDELKSGVHNWYCSQRRWENPLAFVEASDTM